MKNREDSTTQSTFKTDTKKLYTHKANTKNLQKKKHNLVTHETHSELHTKSGYSPTWNALQTPTMDAYLPGHLEEKQDTQ